MFGKRSFEGDCGVFLQHLQYLCQVCVEFFDGFTLGVRTWNSWHIAHQQSRVWIAFDLNGRDTRPALCFCRNFAIRGSEAWIVCTRPSTYPVRGMPARAFDATALATASLAS